MHLKFREKKNGIVRLNSVLSGNLYLAGTQKNVLWLSRAKQIGLEHEEKKPKDYDLHQLGDPAPHNPPPWFNCGQRFNVNKNLS